jgi:hypothetical protein
VKTRLLAGGAQHRIGAKLPGERRIPREVAPNNEISHCRYGRTFSHSLGGKRTLRSYGRWPDLFATTLPTAVQSPA